MHLFGWMSLDVSEIPSLAQHSPWGPLLYARGLDAVIFTADAEHCISTIGFLYRRPPTAENNDTACPCCFWTITWGDLI